jgi:hypothetical protein
VVSWRILIRERYHVKLRDLMAIQSGDDERESRLFKKFSLQSPNLEFLAFFLLNFY